MFKKLYLKQLSLNNRGAIIDKKFYDNNFIVLFRDFQLGRTDWHWFNFELNYDW
jgi:hypothetical protein